MTITPRMLGMEKTIELTAARQETFFYRGMNKRLIDHQVVDQRRWKNVAGPLVYAVTDNTGVIRYIGKWVTASPLCSRWVRHKTIHHQESARNLYIEELDAGRGPLSVWSISISELKPKLPTVALSRSDEEIAAALEALWIQRWRSQLSWNGRAEQVRAGFDDGDYWRISA